MTTTELHSLAELCGMLKRSPGQIRHALNEIGEQPAFRVNGRDCWSSKAADGLFEHFQKQEQKR